MSEFERVRIQLGDTDSRIVESFELKRSFFAQPGGMSVRVGHGGTVRDIEAAYPPGTPYTMWIDTPDGQSIPQMCGRLDDHAAEGSAGATEVNLRGRDWIMPIHDSEPRTERTFGQVTYKALTESVFAEVSIEGYSLNFNNELNTRAVIGIPKFETKQEPQFVNSRLLSAAIQQRADTINLTMLGPLAYSIQVATTRIEMVDVAKIVGYDVPNPLKAKPGESWFRFLQQAYNRTGLFLIAGVDEKNFILTQPSALQAPTFRIVRRRGDSRGVIRASFQNSTSGRHSHYVVYGRGGGGADGRKQIKGEYTDEEMVKWGLIKVRSRKDDLAKTSKQAEYFARRLAAEERRAGWRLSYTVRGLTWPLVGSDTKRGVWSIDSIVDVQDEEYGIFGPMWIADMTQRGSGKGPTETDIVLMRPGDLLFGDEPKTQEKAA